jgi:hypothetical protein
VFHAASYNGHVPYIIHSCNLLFPSPLFDARRRRASNLSVARVRARAGNFMRRTGIVSPSLVKDTRQQRIAQTPQKGWPPGLVERMQSRWRIAPGLRSGRSGNIQRTTSRTRLRAAGRNMPNRQGKTGNTAAAHSAKIGRNGPCPCGSARKLKHCCGVN